MSAIRQTLTILKRITIVIGIAIAFTLGLLGAIYLSLRSSETRVPDIVGKNRNSAETTISDAGLNFRVRATRATSEAKPAGEVVKVGQTVAVDISRPTKEGEPSTPVNTNENANKQENSSASSANNSNANANANSNRKKPANRNANDNLNGNVNANRPANRNRNGNTNLNTNTTPVNHNANATGTPTRSNLNSNTPARNANRPPVNVNRRPVTAPTP